MTVSGGAGSVVRSDGHWGVWGWLKGSGEEGAGDEGMLQSLLGTPPAVTPACCLQLLHGLHDHGS